MGPKVGVGVDHRALWDFEYFVHGDGQESKGSELGVFLEIIVGVSANQNGSSFQAGEALESGGPITFRVTPFSVPVEVIVGDHPLPEGGDFIVRQAEVTAGDGSAREAADKEVVEVSPEFLADTRQVHLAVVDGGLSVAPPLHGILLPALLDIRHGYPDEAFPSAQAVAQIRSLHLSGGSAERRFVASVLDEHGIGLSLLPIGWQVERVVDLRALVLGGDLAHPFAWRGGLVRHDGSNQVLLPRLFRSERQSKQQDKNPQAMTHASHSRRPSLWVDEILTNQESSAKGANGSAVKTWQWPPRLPAWTSPPRPVVPR